MRRVSEELILRRQKKQLVSIAKRRNVYLIKQACRHFRKVVPKLVHLKMNQRRLSRRVLSKNLKKLRQRMDYRTKLVNREQARIEPVLVRRNTRLLTRVFSAIQERLATRKNLASILIRKLKYRTC